MNGPVQIPLPVLEQPLAADVTVTDSLAEACQWALRSVPHASYAGITLTVDGTPCTYVHTDPAVVEVDLQQYATGEGPCLDAMHTGTVVRLDSTDGDGPYVAFRRACARHGIGSVLSLPMTVSGKTTGSLNLYAPTAGGFDADDAARALMFATHAAVLTMTGRAHWEVTTANEQLVRALESRATIEQAKGIIMATTGVSPDEAFEQLRRQSQHENVKLREIASEIVARAQRTAPPANQSN